MATQLQARLQQRLWTPGVVVFFMTALAGLFLIMAALSGCGGNPAPVRQVPKVKVTSFSPVGTEGKAREEQAPAIRIRFDKPVVAEGAVGKAVAAPPVKIEPSLRVVASWTDRQTLLLEPVGRLRSSTRYKVSLKGGGIALEGDSEFEFVNRPLVVERITGIDTDRVAPSPRFRLHFNQPVKAGEVAAACTLAAAGAKEALPLTSPDGDLELRAVFLQVKQPLAQGKRFKLNCAGLKGSGGNAAMGKPYEVDLATYPGFKVATATPDVGNVPADEVRVQVKFSTPVRLADVRKQIYMHPWTPKVRKGSLDRAGKVYTAVVDLKTTTKYTVRVAKGLKDIHGQELGRAKRWSFFTSDAAARLSMERGIYAVEAGAEGYPVWTRNVGKFQVQCARVAKKSVVRVLTSDMNYDPWYGGYGDKALGWKKMGLRPRKAAVKIKEAKNKWHLSNLKMNTLCDAKDPGPARGLFLAELSSKEVEPDDNYRYRPRQRVLANVTDMGVLLKVGPASGIIWVTGISDGKPVPGAAVTVYNLRGKKSFTGRTDKQGLVRLPSSKILVGPPSAADRQAMEDEEYTDYDLYRAQRVIAVVEKGRDMAVVDGNWQNGIQIWNFGVPVDKKGGKARVRGFIQSDRGIYRPGEKVHFKGLAREIAMGKNPRIPRKRKIAITVEDSRESTVYRRTLKLSAFGGFAFDLKLGKEAALGDYHVTATISGQVFRERFMVEEFRKVTYEVDMKGAERHTRLGAKQRVKLQADYLFGAPVKEAQVSWTVSRREHMLRFSKFPGFTFADHAASGSYWWWWGDEDDRYPQFVSDGEGETDKKGAYGFAFRDSDGGLSGPQDYIIQATVTDETDQSVSKRRVITAHKTDHYLGLHPQEFVQAVDMPFAVNTVALSPDGKQVAAEATLHFIRERYVCKSSGGYRSYSSCSTKHDKVLTRKVRIAASGATVQRLVPKKPGEYIVRLEGKDARGNRVATSSYIWVIGKGEAFWSGDESARLTLIADKTRYTPGQTARLVPRTNMPGATALITLERNGVLDAMVTTLETSGSGIEIPIKDHHAPNVYASVALTRGRVGQGDRNRPRFKLGVVDLKVSAAANRLSVAVETDKESYEPGEPVTGKLLVTSADGKPVKAEVSLSAADEGVLQLIAYKTPDPMKNFYAAWGLGIDSSTNWNRVARLNDPTAMDYDEGGDGDSGGPTAQKVRSRFVSSAFWAPSLITDANGEVSFTFKAPDNLTAFRLMAVAADVGHRFGSGEMRIKVAKPLLAKAVLPRFFSAGDRVEVGVMVHNYSGQSGTATVTARASGLKIRGASRKVKLEKDGSARVRFDATALFVKRAKVTFAVKMGEHSDALSLKLPVGRPMVTERTTLAEGEVKGEQKVNLTWPAGILPADSRLEVSVDRTGLSELRGSLRYLVQYPYGCLEQTLSRFIPLTKVKDLAASLGMAELRGARMRTFIRAGAAKVVRHQHDTGHFSLWPGTETYPHLTTYALFGLNEARRAGVKVDVKAVARGLTAMRGWANSSKRTLGPGGESATVAMAAYVLADQGKADEGLNARLYEARKALPLYGQAFLLRALHAARADAEKIKILKVELLAAVKGEGETAMARETVGGKVTPDSLHYYMSSDVRTSAIVMAALVQVEPKHPVVARLANGLKKARRKYGRWGNTQENLYSLIALADYARDRSRGRAKVTVSLGKKRLVRRNLSGSKVLGYTRALSRLKKGELTIKTNAPVRYSVRLFTARKTSQEDSIARGLKVTREYLNPNDGKPVSSVSAGDLVKVRLTVQSEKDHHYVALADPLPGGLEALNTKLATTRQATPGKSDDPTRRRYWWSRPVWTHRELRDDRVLAFSDRMPRGKHTLEYTARATIPGKFTAAPAQAEAMYEPDVMGRTAAEGLEVAR